VIHSNWASTKKRRYLTLRLTSDGENWTKSVRINSDCGYSSLTKTRDYRVGVLWEKKASPDVRRNTDNAKDLVFDKYSLKQLGF